MSDPESYDDETVHFRNLGGKEKKPFRSYEPVTLQKVLYASYTAETTPMKLSNTNVFLASTETSLLGKFELLEHPKIAERQRSWTLKCRFLGEGELSKELKINSEIILTYRPNGKTLLVPSTAFKT